MAASDADGGDVARPEGLRLTSPLPLALFVLTFTTGLVDAVSYLGLGQVFTGFVTGNVVLLGFAFAGASGFSVAAPVVSLGSFLAGAVVGGRLAVHFGEPQHRWLGLALLTEAAFVGLAALSAIGLDADQLTDRRFLVISLLGVAMGIRNASVRRLAVPDLTTTVLTLTITGLAADSPLAGAETKRPRRRIVAIAAMLLGAFVGALLVRVSLLLPLVMMAALVALTAVAYAGHHASRPALGAKPSAPDDDS
jgi:uncharacterized membrane protein YoaK (UPF0700 family)